MYTTYWQQTPFTSICRPATRIDRCRFVYNHHFHHNYITESKYDDGIESVAASLWYLSSPMDAISERQYDDVIMGAIATLITSLMIVYSTVNSDADQIKHQSHASLAFVWGMHRGPVNSPHKWPVTRKMFPFDDVIVIGDFKTIK